MLVILKWKQNYLSNLKICKINQIPCHDKKPPKSYKKFEIHESYTQQFLKLDIIHYSIKEELTKQ